MISERSRGYVLGAIAAASYGLNPLFALPLYGAGLGVDSVLFYRYVLAVVMLGALMLFRRQSFALRRRDVLPLAAMGVLFSVPGSSEFSAEPRRFVFNSNEFAFEGELPAGTGNEVICNVCRPEDAG